MGRRPDPRPQFLAEAQSELSVHDRLVVNEVSVAIDGHPILAPTSFCVDPGKVTAVVGPSGSGKSTLLDCLMAWQTPTTGEIRLGDTLVSGLKEPRSSDFRRTDCGVVMQEALLLEELSVRDNVSLVMRFKGLPPDASAMRADAALAAVGLADFGTAQVGRLSGGEAQRVAIARATSSPVRLMIADEPTAALDRANATRVASLLIERARSLGVPLVLATHDTRVAEACDAIVDLGSAA